MTQHQLGLFHGFPAWWKKHQAELARQRDVVPSSMLSPQPSQPPTPTQSQSHMQGLESAGGGGGGDDEGLRMSGGAGSGGGPDRFLTRGGGGNGGGVGLGMGPGVGLGVGMRSSGRDTLRGDTSIVGDTGGGGSSGGGGGGMSSSRHAPQPTTTSFAWRRAPTTLSPPTSMGGGGVGSVGLGMSEHHHHHHRHHSPGEPQMGGMSVGGGGSGMKSSSSRGDTALGGSSMQQRGVVGVGSGVGVRNQNPIGMFVPVSLSPSNGPFPYTHNVSPLRRPPRIHPYHPIYAMSPPPQYSGAPPPIVTSPVPAIPYRRRHRHLPLSNNLPPYPHDLITNSHLSFSQHQQFPTDHRPLVPSRLPPEHLPQRVRLLQLLRLHRRRRLLRRAVAAAAAEQESDQPPRLLQPRPATQMYHPRPPRGPRRSLLRIRTLR